MCIIELQAKYVQQQVRNMKPIRKPEEFEIQRAQESLYMDRLLELKGEALDQADDMKQIRIAMAVIAQDPLEVGQLVMDILETYCKVSEEEAYEKAQELIEFGDSE